MTECSQSEFEFKGHFSRRVGAAFDGGTMTSDGGAVLLRETDRRLNLLPRLAECFFDRRNPIFVTHSVAGMLAQRVYGLALGYEDLNDHEQLRQDPLLHVLAGQAEMDEPLAGKSTLNRLELGDGSPHRYKKITYWKDCLDALLVSVFLEAFETSPEEIVLDLDTTDVELNGKQEGRFFHGYYDEYCYLPLYIFAGEHLLCVRLREADRDAADGCLAEVQRIVEQIRARWSQVHIILRGDSGFCRDELMDWAEQQEGIDYVFGVPRNASLRRLIAPQVAEAAAEYGRTGKRARVFTEFQHDTTTGSWSRARRVVAKAEQLDGKENPRYVVTSLPPEQSAGTTAIRRSLLRTRRYGESHQGAVPPVRRAGQYRDDARQPISDVSIWDGIRAGQRPPPTGVEGHGIGHRASGDDPRKALQDRRTSNGECAPSVAVNGIELPSPAALPPSLGKPALLKRTRRGATTMRILGRTARLAGACQRGGFQTSCCIDGPSRCPATGPNRPLFFRFRKIRLRPTPVRPLKQVHDRPVRNGG